MPTSANHSQLSATTLLDELMTADTVGEITTAVRQKLRDITVDNGALLIAAHIIDRVARGEDGEEFIRRYDFSPHVISESTSLVHASTLLSSSLATHATDTNPRLLTQLAGYLGTPLMVEWCRILTTSRHALDEDQYLALLTVTTGVQAVLAHPELIDGNDTSLDALRRREARELTVDPNAQRRIDSASSTYVLSHYPNEIARHVMLAEPEVARDTVRMRVHETTTFGEWLIDLVCHDTHGLLAHITSTFTSQGMNVLSADLATWPDGTVIDTFLIRCQHKPDERIVGAHIESSLSSQTVSRPHGEHRFTVVYDDDVLPWHTVVTVTGRDEPGALQDIAAAFAGVGINVHHAHISGDGVMMTDRFEVTDRHNEHISIENRSQFEALLNGH